MQKYFIMTCLKLKVEILIRVASDILYFSLQFGKVYDVCMHNLSIISLLMYTTTGKVYFTLGHK